MRNIKASVTSSAQKYAHKYLSVAELMEEFNDMKAFLSTASGTLFSEMGDLGDKVYHHISLRNYEGSYVLTETVLDYYDELAVPTLMREVKKQSFPSLEEAMNHFISWRNTDDYAPECLVFEEVEV